MESLPSNLPDFGGKTVTLYADGWASEQILAVLASPQYQVQAGRLFLVGDTVTTEDSWAHGATAAVAWESVGSYIATDANPFQAQPPKPAKPSWRFW